MKKLIGCLIILAAIIIPLACGNQNNVPAGPIAGPGVSTSTPTTTPTYTITPGGPTFTSTLTNTITATPTNTFAGGFTWTPSNTATNSPTITATGTVSPTPTFAVVAPSYEHTYGTGGSPNGMVILGGQMSVAENGYNGVGGLNEVQFFTLGAGGITTAGPFASGNDEALVGIPTPALTPPWAPTTITLAGPQGFIYPVSGNYAAILDINGSGGATLYQGSNNMGGYGAYGNGFNYLPNFGNAYGIGGTPFNNPKGLTVDSVGSIYITDTGNNRVVEFDGIAGYANPTWVIGEHFWTGDSNQSFTNPTTGVAFTSVKFISPYGITCDSNDNVWVTDTGYYNNSTLHTNYSVISEYSKYGGVTIMTSWPTITGCKATGIAIAPVGSNDAGDVFIADSANNFVEIYDKNGTLLSELTELQNVQTPNGVGLAPAGLAFNANDLWVGDINNDCIASFLTH